MLANIVDSSPPGNDNWASKAEDPLYTSLAYAYKRYTKDNPNAPMEETKNFLKQTFQGIAHSPQILGTILQSPNFPMSGSATNLSDIGTVGRNLLVSVMTSLRKDDDTQKKDPNQPQGRGPVPTLRLRRLSANNINLPLQTSLDRDALDSCLATSRRGSFKLPNTSRQLFTELTPNIQSRYELETKLGEGAFGKVGQPYNLKDKY